MPKFRLHKTANIHSLQMKTKIIVATVLALSTIACKNEPKPKREIPDWVEYKFMSYEAYYVSWKSDVKKPFGFPDLSFDKSKANYYFTKSVGLEFTCGHLDNRKIELIWPGITDSEIKFFSDIPEQVEYPKQGDVFATFNLVNDTIMRVDYRFEEWRKAVNATKKDSVFPKYLHYLRE